MFDFDDDERGTETAAADRSGPREAADRDIFDPPDPEALSDIAMSCEWNGDGDAAALLWAVADYLRAKAEGSHPSELSSLQRAHAALTVRRKGERNKSPVTHAFERIVEIVNADRESGRGDDDESLTSALLEAWLYVHGDDAPTFVEKQAARAAVRQSTRRMTGVCDAETFARACLKAVGVARPDNVKSAAHGKRQRRSRRTTR